MWRVKQVISGDEIIVEPKWAWKGYEGNRVVIFGYQTPKPGMQGYEFAVHKLKALIEGKQIALYSPQFFEKIGYSALVCNVYLDDIDIANYFPEFIRDQSGTMDWHDINPL